MELSLNKKALILSLVTILLLFSFSLVALSADIHIEIDGNTLQSDVVPIIKDARILVPFRIIAEAIDIDVSWDEQTKSINAQKGADKLILNIGSKTAYFNKVPVLLDVAPEIINNRVLIPLRFFSNVFDCEVGWLEASKTAIIKTPSPAMRAVGYYALGDSQSSSWTDLFTTPYPETNMGNTELITDLALGWYSLDENGNLLTKSRTGWQRPEGWETVLRAAKKYNLDTEMVIHMTNEGHIITSLLTNPHSVDQAIKQIVLESANYAGVNLDLEGLGLSEKG
ncbi:MAG: copper amine oxidase, partial [Syntrophomonadaceae bacterium]|nr:copper amine oxidase [Syntrophomonadaceae bacterium]